MRQNYSIFYPGTRSPIDGPGSVRQAKSQCSVQIRRYFQLHSSFPNLHTICLMKYTYVIDMMETVIHKTVNITEPLCGEHWQKMAEKAKLPRLTFMIQSLWIS